MKRLLLSLILGLTLLLPTACASADGAALHPAGRESPRTEESDAAAPRDEPVALPTRSASQLVRGVAPSVVRVYTAEGEGTGFVAFVVGSVLTAFHVVGNVDSMLTVVSADGTQYRAMVLGADEGLDVALLSVPGLKAPPLPLGVTVETGDTVYAVGYPAGLLGEASITQGIVSARRGAGESGSVYLQTDAPINPGNSGGPLLNTQGEVVGVNMAVLRGYAGEYEGMGFALSTESIHAVYEAMRSGQVRLLPSATPLPSPKPPPTAISRPTATLPVSVPAGWQEYEYWEYRRRYSVWYPQTWMVITPAHARPAGDGMRVQFEPADHRQVGRITLAVRSWGAGCFFSADGQGDAEPDECLRCLARLELSAWEEETSGAGWRAPRIVASQYYGGPQGIVYVVELEVFDSASGVRGMGQTRFVRGPSAGLATAITYFSQDTQGMTWDDLDLVRQMLNSVRVLDM